MISFDTATNRGEQSSAFRCSNLFKFFTIAGGSGNINGTELIGDDIPKNCHWMDDITVSFQSNMLSVGDKVELRSTSYIKTSCTGVTTSCAPTGAFVASFAIIQTAVNPISPDIVISLPKYAGPSSPLTIDLTSSSGQGGRGLSLIHI